MNTKTFWKSRTFWFNILALLLTVAESAGYSNFVPSEETGQAGLILVTIVNLVLRARTNMGVTLK